MTREQGVNRVVLAVWDLERGMEFYSRLLASAFVETTTDAGRAFGVRVAMNFVAGVELVSPLPGAERSRVREHLEAQGEGVTGIVFAVPDVEEAREAAEGLGWSPFHELEHDAETLAREGRFTRFKEYFYEGTAPLPVTVLLGEFDISD